MGGEHINGEQPMKVREIREHFILRASWVDSETTVDRVITGDPDRSVRSCLVTWISSFAACREAVARGVDLLITHEPTFWNHRDDVPGQNPNTTEKQKFLETHGLTILRNHDVWDRFPGVGIPWAWAQFLDLGDAPVATARDGYQHRYDIDPVPLSQFAATVATRTSTIGEPVVQVTGADDCPVSRIGIGTGCGCQIQAYMDMGCDCSVVCDDGSCYWAGIQMAEDLGHAVIRVNHGTSEEPGMVSLTRYINENLDGVVAEHLPHGSTFHLVAEHGRL